MPKYDFRTLSPIDFEGLVRDILQEELGISLESFKTGRDLGIDFRYCSNGTQTVIIQCKHYTESGYNSLYRVLASKELDKVRKLIPTRYIVATSVGLSPPQKDKIVKLFAPHIKSPSDVLGKDDINNLLGKYPHIERKTLKLWLFSLPILEEVLHSRIRNFSRSEIDRIQEHAKLYVQNESFEEAFDILEKHNFCIIAGIPGIGKTILAEVLVLHYARAGYDVVKVSEDIVEAWEVGLADGKRVFYYDDFLGQTSFSEKLHKNEDQRLIDFIHAVRRSSGVKLIMTTREYILKQARQQYERLDREGFDSQKCIIDLEKYTRLNRARILFNHIYFSCLPEKYRRTVLADRNFLRIIDHRNYSPRIIQMMTEHARISDVDPSQYMDHFLAYMKNPLDIWEHAFRRHLSQASRNLLVVLVSMPSEVFLKDLERAFQSYNLAYAKRYQPGIGPQEFRSALKELEGDFLIFDKESHDILVRYQNPSVEDFIKEYLSTSSEEMLILAMSVVYYEQFRNLWSGLGQRSDRETLIQLFMTDAEMAVSLVRRLLSSPPCGIVRVIRGRQTVKEPWPIPLENKVAFVASLVADSYSMFLPLLKDETRKIGRRLLEGKGDRNGVGRLIEQISSLKESDEDWARDFRILGIRFLMTDPTWADDLQPLCDLVNERPELFSEEDREAIKHLVSEVAESIASDNLDLDSEALREEAEALESIAIIVDANIEHEIDDIRRRADEMEDRKEEEDEIEYSSSEANSDYTSDDDIASLFSTLVLTP